MPDPKLIEVAEEWMPADSAIPDSDRTVLVTNGTGLYAIAYYNHSLKGWAYDKTHSMTTIYERYGRSKIVLEGSVYHWMDIL